MWHPKPNIGTRCSLCGAKVRQGVPHRKLSELEIDMILLGWGRAEAITHEKRAARRFVLIDAKGREHSSAQPTP